MKAIWVASLALLAAALDCQTECLECQNSASFCTVCRPPLILVDNACVQECPLGTFHTGTTCESCDSNCLGCESSATNCTSCRATTFLLETSCVTQCPDDFYITLDQYCVRCTAPCRTCLDLPRFCTQCEPPFVLNNAKCVESCPVEKVLFEGTCGNTCPSGTSLNDTVCLTCPVECAECEGVKCTRCPSKQFLYQGNCYDSCPEDVTVPTGQACVDCQGCEACQGFASNCIDCPNTIYHGACVNDCPTSTTIRFGKVCRDCKSPCAECEVATTNCTSCVSGFIQDGNDCILACPDGKFIGEGHCLDCGASCKSCEGAADNCTSCEEGLLLDGSQCVETCPDGKRATLYTCEDCNSTCRTCDATGCLTCLDGLLLNGVCVEACPTGYVDDLEGNCTAICDVSCASCSGPSSSECTACHTNQTLVEGLCVFIRECDLSDGVDGQYNCTICEDNNVTSELNCTIADVLLYGSCRCYLNATSNSSVVGCHDLVTPLRAYFSPSYLSLIVEFPTPREAPLSCSDIFLNRTFTKLGTSSSCRWNRALTQVEAVFGKQPTLVNEIVFLNSSGTVFALVAEFVFPPIEPVPVYDYPFEYALSCATRLFWANAQYSSGSAGRALQYSWHFDTFVAVGPKPDPSFLQKFDSKEFSSKEGQKYLEVGWASSYRIIADLTVRNWLQKTAFKEYFSSFVFFGEVHPTILIDGANVVTMKRSETRDFVMSLQFKCTSEDFLLFWQYVTSLSGAPQPDLGAILGGSPSSDVLRIPANSLLPNNDYIFRAFALEAFLLDSIDFLTINVISTPLQIRVNRASGNATYTRDLFLSAIESADPDEMPGNLSFAWNCTSNCEVCLGVDGLPLIEIGNISEFTIPAARLIPHSVLEFEVTISKDSRNKSLSFVLSLDSVAPVSLYTSYPIDKLNPQAPQQVSIRIDALTSTDIQWTQLEGRRLTSSTGLNFPSLTFLPNSMEENQRYVFEAKVSVGDDYVTILLDFVANLGPTLGSLQVTPSAGRANETVIDLVAVGWIDGDEADYPLTFEFGYLIGNAFIAIASPQYEMLLRVKPVEPGRIRFGVKVCDALKTCATATNFVTLGKSKFAERDQFTQATEGPVINPSIIVLLPILYNKPTTIDCSAMLHELDDLLTTDASNMPFCYRALSLMNALESCPSFERVEYVSRVLWCFDGSNTAPYELANTVPVE